MRTFSLAVMSAGFLACLGCQKREPARPAEPPPPPPVAVATPAPSAPDPAVAHLPYPKDVLEALDDKKLAAFAVYLGEVLPKGGAPNAAALAKAGLSADEVAKFGEPVRAFYGRMSFAKRGGGEPGYWEKIRTRWVGWYGEDVVQRFEKNAEPFLATFAKLPGPQRSSGPPSLFQPPAPSPTNQTPPKNAN